MTNPVQLNVIRRGKGQPVVLLHGLFGSTLYWEKVAAQIPSNKYELIMADLLGFGRSPRPKGLHSYSVEKHAETVYRSVLSHSKRPVTLVGHSMGAIIALRLAVKHPDKVSRLILVNMPLFEDAAQATRKVKKSLSILENIYVSWPGLLIYGLRTTLLRRIIQRPLLRSGMSAQLADDYIDHTWHSMRGSLHGVVFRQRAYADLHTVTTPTTIIYGKDDRLSQHGLAELLTHFPHHKTIGLPGGHRLPLSNPTAIAGEITSLFTNETSEANLT